MFNFHGGCFSTGVNLCSVLAIAFIPVTLIVGCVYGVYKLIAALLTSHDITLMSIGMSLVGVILLAVGYLMMKPMLIGAIGIGSIMLAIAGGCVMAAGIALVLNKLFFA